MPSRSQLTVYGSIPIHRDFQRLDSQTFQHFQWSFTHLETSTGETGHCQGGGAPPCYGHLPSPSLTRILDNEWNITSLGRLVSFRETVRLWIADIDPRTGNSIAQATAHVLSK
jgi:hypothetical protein